MVLVQGCGDGFKLKINQKWHKISKPDFWLQS